MMKKLFTKLLLTFGIFIIACSGGGPCTISANGAVGQVLVNFPGGKQSLLTVDGSGNVTYDGPCQQGTVVVDVPND